MQVVRFTGFGHSRGLVNSAAWEINPSSLASGGQGDLPRRDEESSSEKPSWSQPTASLRESGAQALDPPPCASQDWHPLEGGISPGPLSKVLKR